MSGGTDSSVAALLLQDAGYEVTGITFRFYEKENDTEYLEDARALCERLNIPHLTYDVRDTFRKTIIDYFINEYMAGHTPVPCTLCNNYLKWPLLKKISDEWEFITSLQDIMYAGASSMDAITSLPVPTRIKTNPFSYGGCHKKSCNVCFSLWAT